MGRPLKIEYEGAVYQITVRGNEKRDVFIDESDYRKFLDIGEKFSISESGVCKSVKRVDEKKIKSKSFSKGVKELYSRFKV